MPTYLIVKPPTFKGIPSGLKRNDTFTVPYYIDSDQLELLTHEPLWDIGMTKSIDRGAIDGVVYYDVPEHTAFIKIQNLSRTLLKVYNYDSETELIVTGQSTIVIPDIKNRIRKLRIKAVLPVPSHQVFVYYFDTSIGLGSSGGGGGGITSGGAPSTMERDVMVLVETGALKPGDVLPEGTTFQEFIEQLLLTTFYPTFTNPSLSLTSNHPSTLEAGSSPNLTLSLSFNKGSIRGKLVGSLWDGTALQNPRAGNVVKYTINGTGNGSDPVKNIGSVTIDDGVNTWGGEVQYEEGPQPLDSKNSPYQSRLVEGTISATTTITGHRRLFYGTDMTNATIYSNSDQVRALLNHLVNPANNSTFTINIPAGAKQVVFAYPATLRDVNSVKFVEGMNAEIKGSFVKTSCMVEGANGYMARNYKVYTFIPANPFGQPATYTVTI